MAFVTKTLQFKIVVNEHTDIEKVRVTAFAEQYFNEHKNKISHLVTINKRTLSLVKDDQVYVRNNTYLCYVVEYTLDLDTLSTEVAVSNLESIYRPLASRVEVKKGGTLKFQVVSAKVI